MLGELSPLSVNPCRALMQTSLSVKSQNALVSVDSVSRNQALFSPQPFDPFISQSAHMVLRADMLHPSQLPRMKRSQLLECLSLARALRGCIKIAGIRMPELAFSMSSNLFLIMTTFPWRNNTSGRTFKGNYSSSALQKRVERQMFFWLWLCWIYTLHNSIHIRCIVKMHGRVSTVHPVNNRFCG